VPQCWSIKLSGGIVPVEAEVSFHAPASLRTKDVRDSLFNEGSGLKPLDSSAAQLDELNSEFETWVSLSAVVISAVQAGLSLAQLVQLVRDRRESASPPPDATPTNATPIEINITVEGAQYNISGLSPEQIRRLLEP
jgi:hypothetical protein